MRLTLLLLLLPLLAVGQGRTHDIPASELPANVRSVLTEYLSILRSQDNLDDVADAFLAVAGGSLVNEGGKSLRSSVKPYSLKKDFENIRFYANPAVITRVNRNPTPKTSGYGPSAIRGTVYKIWIEKADGQAGMPAPISIIVPEGSGAPKVIGIGSL